ncbi:putative peptidoglycan biosynthesis protein MurJ [Peptococcaceae bacterium CEB3]|nr:putative peptidoglycan biosynthesis protein MurJ [Peptococcaceae bacterium CEB3]
MSDTSTRNLARATAYIMAAYLASRVLGFLRESLVADFFGKNGLTDAYNTAYILPDLIYWLMVGGVLSSAFIPVLSEYIAKGKKEEGWRVVSSVINIIFLALGCLIILGLIFTPQFVRMEVPGFPPATMALTVQVTRILLIQPLFMAMSGLTMGILNAHKIFWPSALGTVLYNACIIVFGTLFIKMGAGISGFAFGVVIGAAANFAVQVPALRRVEARYYPIIDWHHPGVRRIAALAVPIVLSYSLNQFQVMINSHLGSSLPAGSLTALWQSYRLFQLPVGIFAMSVAVAVFPTLTEQAAIEQWDQFRRTSSAAIRTVIFITMPVSVGMIVLRFPLIRVLFQHGAFKAADTAATAFPLLYFGFGIVAQSVIQILPRMFYAVKDTWTPVVLGVVSMVVDIIMMILLVGPLQQGGLAFATAISAIVNMLLLLYWLRRKVGTIDGRRLASTVSKSLFASLIMGGIVWGWSAWLSTHLGFGTMASILVLVSGSAIGAVVFAVLAKLMRMEEFTQVMGLAGRRLKLRAAH